MARSTELPSSKAVSTDVAWSPSHCAGNREPAQPVMERRKQADQNERLNAEGEQHGFERRRLDGRHADVMIQDVDLVNVSAER